MVSVVTDNFSVRVGEGEEGYNAMIAAFQDYKIGTYAKAIMLNSLHPNLPRVAILTMPTCNSFDNDFVPRQWQEIKRLYEQELEPVAGTLISNSSDGDSRRRKLMLQLANCKIPGTRFHPIPLHLEFMFS